MVQGNGDGSGLTHNMYIDRIDRFTITNSLVQNAFGGHNIKSRAFNSDVENNRIFDGPFGYSNNDIDFPVGGNEIVKNNMLEKGPLARGTFISWNEENYLPTLNNPGTSMVIDGNTFIDNWTAANSYYQAVHTAGRFAVADAQEGSNDERPRRNDRAAHEQQNLQSEAERD